jgi:serine/threonine protein kinase
MSSRERDYQPGQRLPGTVYEVVRLIGAGGMGTVYDVEDTTIGKRYVLKTLHPQLGAREDLARRMQNEARTLARLNHPNIVEVITAGITADDLRLPYYVMERLNGQSLRVVLEKKGQLELPHAIHIGIDLLDALDHAHDKGVIHRDVKPDNIFLHRTSGGVTVTKLLDFGILSLLDSAKHETGGRFLGTLRYAAPEQLRGDPPSPKVDIYAAGLVLYEMVAGRGPFDEEGDTRAIGAAHMEKSAPPLTVFATVPGEFEALVTASLAKAPEARPRDAFSFATKLREIKRALSGGKSREATLDRASTAAVIGRESAPAPYVEVRQPSPDGPYVISPARDCGPQGQTSPPKTTLPGFIPPTLGPSLAPVALEGPTATTPEVVDRMATTKSFVPDTVASPRDGTEPLAPSLVTPPSPGKATPQPAVDALIRWPSERPPATSEEPQVQTLSAWAPRPFRLARRMVAAAAMVGIVAVAAVLVLMAPGRARDKAVVPPATALATPSAQTAALQQAPSVAPQDPATSPPLPAGTTETVKGPTKAPARASAPAQHLKASHTASAAKLATSPPHTDRPGPGF